MIFSYSQIYEDILLWRAFCAHVQRGFYIDIGGFHPEVDSVTKLFYDHGWSGINVEPTPSSFTLFERDRPRDINLKVVAWDSSGETEFHEIVGTGLSTSNTGYASKAVSEGHERISYTVPCRTLADICEEHVGDRPIHFLKVDCEGAEAAALRGADFSRWKPWVVLVEATEPMTSSPAHEEWESNLTRAGYDFVMTDDLNRFYVSPEHPELKPAFAFRADDYLQIKHVNEKEHLKSLLVATELELNETRGRLCRERSLPLWRVALRRASRVLKAARQKE